MRPYAVGLVVVLLQVPGAGHAQTKTGTTIGQFLLIEPSARIAAMGNAGVALNDGIQAIYYNPAAVGQLEQYGFQFTHSPWLADITYDYAAVVVPVRGIGGFFASLTSLNSGEIDVRTVEQPLGTGERYTVSDLAIGLGFGRAVTRQFSAGIQVNYMEETIWHTSARAVMFNVGTVYRLSDSGLQLGASLAHYGTRARYKGRDLRIQYDNDPDQFGDNSALPAEQFTEEYPVPLLLRIGLSYPHQLGEETQLLFAVDASHPRDNTESVSMGAEWSWRNTLALRAGYQDLGQEDSELGLTFGGGVKGDLDAFSFDFDYAWSDYGRLNETHRLSFVVMF